MLAGDDLPEESRNFLIEMQKVGYRPQCRTFSTVIACYARLGQLADATAVFDEMEKAGVKANEVVYGSLINWFAESGRAEEELQYFQWMEECGIPANKVVLTSLIKAYSKLGCVEGAKSIYKRMMRMEGGVDVVASNSMINLYADLGMISEAKLIFDGLIERNIADAVSFATMMFLYKSMGMLDEAIEVTEEMKQTGLLKDCISFNKVMSCYTTILVSRLKRPVGEGQRTSSVLLILEKEEKLPEYILGRKVVKQGKKTVTKALTQGKHMCPEENTWKFLSGLLLIFPNHALEDKVVVEGRDLSREIAGQKGNEGNAAGGEGLKGRKQYTASQSLQCHTNRRKDRWR